MASVIALPVKSHLLGLEAPKLRGGVGNLNTKVTTI